MWHPGRTARGVLMTLMMCLLTLGARAQEVPSPEAPTATRDASVAVSGRWARMQPAHRANLVVHVAAGGLAILVGFGVLSTAKGTARHRRFGRFFIVATSVVVLSAVVGLTAFRAPPAFAMLSLLVGYQLLGGWRVARRRANGPAGFDVLATVLACALGVVLALRSVGDRPDMLVMSSLGALSLVLLWDMTRWAFPRRWHAVLWRYEHGYKLMAALFGMVSALVGNVVRAGQPWSQLVPVAVGLVVTACVLSRVRRGDRRTSGGAVLLDRA